MGKQSEAYLRGIVEPKIDTVDGYHDVPTADTADNNQLRDVIGNKTDTNAGDSIMAKVKTMAGVIYTEVAQPSFAVDGNGAQNDNIFTVVGNVEILGIYGYVNAAADATTCGTCYFDQWDATAATEITDNGGVDLAGATAGSIVMKTAAATVAATLNNASAARVAEGSDAQALYPCILTAKNGVTTYIRFNFTGDANTDITMDFFVRYKALSPGSSITPV